MPKKLGHHTRPDAEIDLACRIGMPQNVAAKKRG
jgi:hypothetical protein